MFIAINVHVMCTHTLQSKPSLCNNVNFQSIHLTDIFVLNGFVVHVIRLLPLPKDRDSISLY